MIMKAKFSSNCYETKKVINKGESIYYDKYLKKAFCSTSKKYEQENSNNQDALLVQANEDAYFDNFCQQNNI